MEQYFKEFLKNVSKGNVYNPMGQRQYLLGNSYHKFKKMMARIYEFKK